MATSSKAARSAALTLVTSRLWLTMTLRSPSIASSCVARTSTVLGVSQLKLVNLSTAAGSHVVPPSMEMSSDSANAPGVRVGKRRSYVDDMAAETVRYPTVVESSVAGRTREIA